MVPDLECVPWKPLRQQKAHQKLSTRYGSLGHILPSVKPRPREEKQPARPWKDILGHVLSHAQVRSACHQGLWCIEDNRSLYVQMSPGTFVMEVAVREASYILTSWLLCLHSRAPGSPGTLVPLRNVAAMCLLSCVTYGRICMRKKKQKNLSPGVYDRQMGVCARVCCSFNVQPGLHLTLSIMALAGGVQRGYILMGRLPSTMLQP